MSAGLRGVSLFGLWALGWLACILPGTMVLGAPQEARTMALDPAKPNVITFQPTPCRFVRLVMRTAPSEPCLDELEVYGVDHPENLALAGKGAKATASSCLPGYAIHQISHLNDGRYGNDWSWIAASPQNEWAQIELPQPREVAQVVLSRDRLGHFADRVPASVEIRLSLDGQAWQTVFRAKTQAAALGTAELLSEVELPEPLTPEGLTQYAFLCEQATWSRLSAEDPLSPPRANRPALPDQAPYWGDLARLEAIPRNLRLMADLLDRLAGKGLDVSAERERLAEFRRQQAALATTNTAVAEEAEQPLYLAIRRAKRELFFRDPELAPLERVLFVKRHPYEPSHNYSDYLDARFRGGGGIGVLEIPSVHGRLEPGAGKLTLLFEAGEGIARDPVVSFDGQQVYFAYRPAGKPGEAYWHLMRVKASGGEARQLTDGPFHDYYPCPLPDGGLTFVSTRCKCRFLCWVPATCVLFRLDSEGTSPFPLSFANLSEWGPSVMADGRILWTRSEYLDKGADFGHTLWAVRPDGTQPVLVYGNNTRNCYMNAHELPGGRELLCTLISHGGDFNGPIALIDLAQGPFNPEAITTITPDVRPRYHMDWAKTMCFRDPYPLSRDHFLVSHAPADRFGLYVLDRYGNREVLYLDPRIGSMSPRPLAPRLTPPVLAQARNSIISASEGTFLLADVYQGLPPTIPRGAIKYLRVCEEVRSQLEQLPDGRLKEEYPPFEDYYAAPTHKVRGPHGWPSFVAKADLGLVPVAADGSASFRAPAGKVLYFQVLDQSFNELQRMRSVVQLQPGETRGCIGCHDHRAVAPSGKMLAAVRREPEPPQPPPWGTDAFSYARIVQPVWDAQCLRCHGPTDPRGFNLAGTLDTERVPASYRTLIERGWVHHFSYQWQEEHHKAEPLTFGTLKSRLWPLLDAGHYEVKLTEEEQRRIKCWTDLNCPLWPDYRFRLDRPAVAATQSPTP